MPKVGYGDYILPSCASQIAQFLAEKNAEFKLGDTLLTNTEWNPTQSFKRRTIVIFDAHDATLKLGPMKTASSGPSCEKNVIAVVAYGGKPSENADFLAKAVNELCSWKNEVIPNSDPPTLLLHIGTRGQPMRLGKAVSGDETRTQHLVVMRRPVNPRDKEWEQVAK